MKLKLIAKQELYVLEITGEIDTPNTAVLKAGITKLLRTGKNRIMLDLNDATVPDTVKKAWWTEMAELHRHALELDGGIVLVGLTDDTQKELSAFAGEHAPFYAANIAAAAHRFTAPKPSVEDPPQMPGGGSSLEPGSLGGGDLAVALTHEITKTKKLEEEIRQLKETVLQKETGELQALRKEASSLKSLNAQLTEQMERLVIERRVPADLTGWEEKTKRLEGQLEEVLKKLGESAEVEAPKPS